MAKTLLEGKHLCFSYESSGKEIPVLKDISFEIKRGDFVALIGVSGSGKTTLIEHLNGLLRAQSGELFYEGQPVYAKGYQLSRLRSQVGLVFQYPEHQLFKRTVIQDVMYGPLNLGQSEAEAQLSAQQSLEAVGLGEEFYNANPAELSGGQKRCAAIAGVLAMHPQVLILDELAAGLDPATKHHLFGLISEIQKEQNLAIVLVSHHMEDVAEYANRVMVLNQGVLAFDTTPRELFQQVDALAQMGLSVPKVTQIAQELKNQGMPLDRLPITLDEVEELLTPLLRGEA